MSLEGVTDFGMYVEGYMEPLGVWQTDFLGKSALRHGAHSDARFTAEVCGGAQFRTIPARHNHLMRSSKAPSTTILKT